MVVFPPCKINLGLHILEKRPDGFHSIETCFYPAPWCDALEIIPSSSSSFSLSGVAIDTDDNLCLRAIRLLRQKFTFPEVKVHLHKTIPTGAGLGGGSSDAAATLTALNKIFSLNLSVASLRSLASELGSDCAFFVEPAPMIGRGKGDVLEPCAVRLKNKHLVIVYPGIHSSTAEAYQGVRPHAAKKVLAQVLGRPVAEWRSTLVNDFEDSVFGRYPVLSKIKDELYALGAQYAGMSGSGSAMFGLFDDSPDLTGRWPEYKCWSGQLTI